MLLCKETVHSDLCKPKTLKWQSCCTVPVQNHSNLIFPQFTCFPFLLSLQCCMGNCTSIRYSESIQEGFFSTVDIRQSPATLLIKGEEIKDWRHVWPCHAQQKHLLSLQTLNSSLFSETELHWAVSVSLSAWADLVSPVTFAGSQQLQDCFYADLKGIITLPFRETLFWGNYTEWEEVREELKLDKLKQFITLDCMI